VACATVAVGGVLANSDRASARAACSASARGPATTVALYEHARRIATASVVACGPASSLFYVTPQRVVALPGVAVVVRRGTCSMITDATVYQVGIPQTGPRGIASAAISAERFHRSTFAVELTKMGATAPYACGYHSGVLPLPVPGQRSAIVVTTRRVGSGAFVGRIDRQCCDEPASIRITPTQGGKASRIVVTASASSSGAHLALRAGSCDHRFAAHEIVLDTLVGDVPSETTVQLPFRSLGNRFVVEILQDASAFDAVATTCFQL
jgi:hypothetical protein